MAFEVNDGIAGFPASAIEHTPQVEMKVEDGSLRIRSARTASCYLGDHAPILKGADGSDDISRPGPGASRYDLGSAISSEDPKIIPGRSLCLPL